MNYKKICKIGLIAFVSILFIGGAGIFLKYNYNNIFNYHEVQEKNKNEIREEYINTLYENKKLTKNDVIDIIVQNDLKNIYYDFTESRPDKFTVGGIESYTINDELVSFDINDELDKKGYNIKNILLVNTTNKNSSKLKVCDNVLKTEDNKEIDIDGMTMYVIVNDVHDNDSDDVFIVTNKCI